MKPFAAILLGVIIIQFSSCSSEPQPLVYGKDVCQFCKMTLRDKKFGAELSTKEGKTYKFDDIGCLERFLNSNARLRMDYSYQLVVDYAHPGELINAAEALYIQSPAVKSPMQGNIAAFNTKKERDSFNNDWHGKQISWDDIVKELK